MSATTQPPIILSWSDELDARTSHFVHSAVDLTDATTAANEASARMADHPVGQRALGFQNITTHFGLSNLQDWPQWCIDKLDPSGAFLSSAITYMTTYFARINTLGIIPDYIALDEEGPVSTFAVFPNTGSTSETNAVTAASWSAGEATYTVASHNGIVTQDVVVDGITPGGFNGKFTIKAQTATTITVDMTVDPGGAGTVFGSLYLALDAREHWYQMVLDDASALANVPAIGVQGQITDATDFRNTAGDSSEKNVWNPWASLQYRQQLKKCVVDIATAQLGTTPVVSNYNMLNYGGTDWITNSGKARWPSFTLGGVGAPNLYLGGHAGGKYSGSEKDQKYQEIIDKINLISLATRRDPTLFMPWVSQATGSPDFRVFSMILRAAKEFGVNRFHSFSGSSSPSVKRAVQMSELYYDILPAITPTRPVIDNFDATTMPTIEVGSVRFDRQEMEDML